MNFNDFSAFVLAGGKSSRMQTDKAFLKIGDETFVERAVKTLQIVCEERVKVILNKTQTDFIEKIPTDVSSIFDVYENRGALGGIHAALSNCKTKYAIILAVDLPLVSSDVIEKLAEITLSSNKFIAVVPRQTDERLQSLCAVYHARFCLPILEDLMATNDSASANDFLEMIFPRTVAQEKLTNNDSTDIFFNVNRPADLENLG